MTEHPTNKNQSGRPSPEGLVIGLTGGIASGKSTVAGLFAERGFAVLDADEVSREVARRPEILRRVEAEFGAQSLGDDGQMDREALARLVFVDPERRKQLEAILHPVIRTELLEALEQNRSEGQDTLLDIPLLFESGWNRHCDHIVFLEVPDEIRERRARERGWEDGELERREKNQWPLAEKRAASDTILPNASDLNETRTELDAVLARWRSS
ncbi:MAG: dephospho-CoA kinase [Planctomycetota bacterium]